MLQIGYDKIVYLEIHKKITSLCQTANIFNADWVNQLVSYIQYSFLLIFSALSEDTDNSSRHFLMNVAIIKLGTALYLSSHPNRPITQALAGIPPFPSLPSVYTHPRPHVLSASVLDSHVKHGSSHLFPLPFPRPDTTRHDQTQKTFNFHVLKKNHAPLRYRWSSFISANTTFKLVENHARKIKRRWNVWIQSS